MELVIDVENHCKSIEEINEGYRKICSLGYGLNEYNYELLTDILMRVSGELNININFKDSFYHKSLEYRTIENEHYKKVIPTEKIIPEYELITLEPYVGYTIIHSLPIIGMKIIDCDDNLPAFGNLINLEIGGQPITKDVYYKKHDVIFSGIFNENLPWVCSHTHHQMKLYTNNKCTIEIARAIGNEYKEFDNYMQVIKNKLEIILPKYKENNIIVVPVNTSFNVTKMVVKSICRIKKLLIRESSPYVNLLSKQNNEWYYIVPNIEEIEKESFKYTIHIDSHNVNTKINTFWFYDLEIVYPNTFEKNNLQASEVVQVLEYSSNILMKFEGRVGLRYGH